jgi:hypothetical protein
LVADCGRGFEALQSSGDDRCNAVAALAMGALAAERIGNLIKLVA